MKIRGYEVTIDPGLRYANELRIEPQTILEELCMDPECAESEETHWHPFDEQSFAQEAEGEYTITLRVRRVAAKVPERLSLRCRTMGQKITPPSAAPKAEARSRSTADRPERAPRKPRPPRR
jgi:hypothetical protein